ncbi:rhomboid family intramembrane serine protease [Oxynema aestuarii]|uniref:Rhomboid family intramembrane serine protease n=1 Tax=Oxynema aestuarii AP17 TaxID=2064643 RepID=A0A6H1TXN2_9CYAN|nr:rhomboid family intramembrane serine protease [Oxynema aestuarii]QIZ70907.1 rhomboid family intramembrane serine protease [Oxynema aestuarii AP17]
MTFHPWMVLLVCNWCVAIAFAILLLNFYKQIQSWLTVIFSILTLTFILFFISPNLAIIVSTILWFLFLFLPVFGLYWIQFLMFRGSYDRARQLAAIVRWLHPADGLVELPHLLKALTLAQRGNIEEAGNIFKSYQTSETAIGRTVTALFYVTSDSWEDLLIWIRENISDRQLFGVNNLVIYYLRALGETGNIHALLQAVERLTPEFEKRQSLIPLALARMYALAFCGKSDSLGSLFDRPLRRYPKNIRQFWMGTAKLIEGKEQEARQIFDAIPHQSNTNLQQAIARRLSRDFQATSVQLSDGDREICDGIITAVEQEKRYGSALTVANNRAYCSYILIGLNLAVFSLQVLLGGSQNIPVLIQLGALIPEAVWEGQWWRLIAANFLHFGPVHLMMNAIGLYIIGGFVEKTLGTIRYFGVYLSSGIASMAVITILSRFIEFSAKITVGASGSVMGLVGATGAILLWGWHREKARIARQRFQLVLLMVGLQMAFDLSVPNISFIGHLSGVIVGFLITLMLMKWVKLPD